MIVNLTKKNIEIIKTCLPDEEREAISRNKKMGFAVIGKEGFPCGAVSLSGAKVLDVTIENNFLIDYVYIIPAQRKKGYFRELIDFFRDNSDKIKDNFGINGLAIQATIPDDAILESALLATGFERLNDGNTIVTIPFDSMDSSSALLGGENMKYFKRLIPLSRLNNEKQKEFFALFGSEFPKALGPKSVAGEFLPQYSAVFKGTDNEYGGFLFTSRLNGDTLYIDSMYVKKEYRHMGPALLAFVLATAMKDKKGFSKIMYALASEESEKLSEHLLKECTGKIEKKEIHNYWLGF